MIRGILASVILGLSSIATAQLPAPDPEIAADKSLADRYPAAQVNFQNGVTGIPGLTYWEPVGYRRLTLDLYLPPRSAPRPSEGFPLVVYIHGGGWRGGNSRRSVPFVRFSRRTCFTLCKGLRGGLHRVSLEWRGEVSGSGPGHESRHSLATDECFKICDRSHSGSDVGCVFAGGHLAGLAAVSCTPRRLH